MKNILIIIICKAIFSHDFMSIVCQPTAILQSVRTSKIQWCPFKRTLVWWYSCRGHSQSFL